MNQKTNEKNTKEFAVAPSQSSLRRRSFWLWQLLTLTTGGVAGIIYLFYNLVDLNRLASYPRPKGAPSLQRNLTFYLVCLLCLPLLPLTVFYLFYLKFELLSGYIDAVVVSSKDQPSEQTTTLTQAVASKPKLMTGRDYFLLNIFSLILAAGLGATIPFLSSVKGSSYYAPITYGIFGLCCVGVIITIIFSLLQSWRWQQLMNKQVALLDPSQKEKKKGL